MASSNLLCHGLSFCCTDRTNDIDSRNVYCYLLSSVVGRGSPMVVALFFQWCKCRTLFIHVFHLVSFPKDGFGWFSTSDDIYYVHVNDFNGTCIVLWRCWCFVMLLVYKVYLRSH